MAEDLGIPLKLLIGNEEACNKIELSRYVNDRIGLPTLKDIVDELKKPGRDPRSVAKVFSFADNIHTIDDLEIGMVVPGIVTNLTNFGAFVDIGVKQDGLVHISEIANTYVNDVNEFLKLGDKVKVRVLAVTPDGKINLSIKKAEPAPERPNNRPMHGGRPGGSRPNNNGGAPRAARPNNRSAQPAGQVSGPSGDAAFEDRLKQFMQESDSRMAGNRLYSDRTRGRRRGSGRG